ncbi:MAG: hypothetical protein CL565_00295 [Alphaproteobacteria bacterium]|nr:hypothetical protein [Alphaproteobacteria bacterium]|tara:strand:- start:161 stop:625 length:465 start_codon:yes stop_codon:yes gene_type:complete
MKMGRFSFILLVSAILISGSLLFSVSQRVQSTEREIGHLREKLSQENESLRVLRAEWAYLNRPDRLEAMAVNGVLPSANTPARLQKKITFNLGVIPTPSRKPSGYLASPGIYSVTNTPDLSVEAIQPVKPEITSTSLGEKSFDSLLDNLGEGNR